MNAETTIKPERLQALHAKLVTIAQECVRVINTQPRAPFIVMIGHFPVKGFPRGKCIGSDSRGRFYAYDAKNLLAKLVALGVITVDARVAPPESEQK